MVGPVRTGKSTFIKRFMELVVLPDISDEHVKNRTRDELPQSSAGKTIMTTEPKFIPKEAAEIQLGDELHAKVRLIDCVGFMVDGATGHIEDDAERLVKTPWYDYEIPFTKAAELGTRKVIRDHSTIGIVVTTDGSFGELKRPNYLAAEEKTIQELKAIGKPFIVLINSARPYSDEAVATEQSLREKYGVTTQTVNCEQLKKDDINHILEKVLKEFPVTQMDFFLPRWLEILPATHWLKTQLVSSVREILGQVNQMKDITKEALGNLPEAVRQMQLTKLDLSSGTAAVRVEVKEPYYYQILSDYVGLPIEGEYQLMQTLTNLSQMKKEYDKVLSAMQQVRQKGYGVVTPERSEIQLDEPQVIRHGNKYGVKMKAKAPAINLIQAEIETEIAPIVGSEQQAKDLIEYIKSNEKEHEDGIWNTNIFGKSVEQIVEDGISAKVSQMTEDCQMKLQDTLQKIINDSSGGMICIII